MARTKEEMKKLYQLDLPMAAVMRNPLDPVAIEKLFQFWKELDLIFPKPTKVYQVSLCTSGDSPNFILRTFDKQKARNKFIEKAMDRFIEINLENDELFNEDEEDEDKRKTKLKHVLLSNQAIDLLLPQEDLAVRIQRMNHEVQQLLYLGLEVQGLRGRLLDSHKACSIRTVNAPHMGAAFQLSSPHPFDGTSPPAIFPAVLSAAAGRPGRPWHRSPDAQAARRRHLRCVRAARGGDLHLFVDRARAHIERAAEDVGKAQHVVDLVRIVRTAGRDDGVLAHFVHVFRRDFRIGIGHREDDRLLGHRLDHLFGHRAGY